MKWLWIWIISLCLAWAFITWVMWSTFLWWAIGLAFILTMLIYTIVRVIFYLSGDSVEENSPIK